MSQKPWIAFLLCSGKMDASADVSYQILTSRKKKFKINIKEEVQVA